jgi:hypothetical protein
MLQVAVCFEKSSSEWRLPQGKRTERGRVCYAPSHRIAYAFIIAIFLLLIALFSLLEMSRHSWNRSWRSLLLPPARTSCGQLHFPLLSHRRCLCCVCHYVLCRLHRFAVNVFIAFFASCRHVVFGRYVSSAGSCWLTAGTTAAGLKRTTTAAASFTSSWSSASASYVVPVVGDGRWCLHRHTLQQEYLGAAAGSRRAALEDCMDVLLQVSLLADAVCPRFARLIMSRVAGRCCTAAAARHRHRAHGCQA